MSKFIFRSMRQSIMILVTLLFALLMTSCSSAIKATGTKSDTKNTLALASNLQQLQPTPTDIDYSLERYNLIKRAYWVNGQREKANTLPCAVVKPLGYIVLFSSNTIIGKFIVDGKVSSLNSYLTPDSGAYEIGGTQYDGSEYSSGGDNPWLADVDGSYGENDSGIFFFTPLGQYIEWTGTYLYSDIPFEVSSPVLTYEEVA